MSKRTELINLIGLNNETALELCESWCTESGCGNVSYTPLFYWDTFCEEHKIKPTDIGYFDTYDEYVYIYEGKVYTTKDLREEIRSGSMFSDCFNYWTSTDELYEQAKNIINRTKQEKNSNMRQALRSEMDHMFRWVTADNKTKEEIVNKLFDAVYQDLSCSKDSTCTYTDVLESVGRVLKERL